MHPIHPRTNAAGFKTDAPPVGEAVPSSLLRAAAQAGQALSPDEIDIFDSHLKSSARRNGKMLETLEVALRDIRLARETASPTETKTVRADFTVRYANRVWVIHDSFLPGERVVLSPAPQGDGLHVRSRDGEPRSTWALPLPAHNLTRTDTPPRTETSSGNPTTTHGQCTSHPHPACGRSAAPQTDAKQLDTCRIRMICTSGEAPCAHLSTTQSGTGCPFALPGDKSGSDR